MWCFIKSELVITYITMLTYLKILPHGYNVLVMSQFLIDERTIFKI